MTPSGLLEPIVMVVDSKKELDGGMSILISKREMVIVSRPLRWFGAFAEREQTYMM
jgi:hypothetical protein